MTAFLVLPLPLKQGAVDSWMLSPFSFFSLKHLSFLRQVNQRILKLYLVYKEQYVTRVLRIFCGGLNNFFL